MQHPKNTIPKYKNKLFSIGDVAIDASPELCEQLEDILKKMKWDVEAKVSYFEVDWRSIHRKYCFLIVDSDTPEEWFRRMDKAINTRYGLVDSKMGPPDSKIYTEWDTQVSLDSIEERQECLLEEFEDTGEPMDPGDFKVIDLRARLWKKTLTLAKVLWIIRKEDPLELFSYCSSNDFLKNS